jgi:hypothetical protein
MRLENVKIVHLRVEYKRNSLTFGCLANGPNMALERQEALGGRPR